MSAHPEGPLELAMTHDAQQRHCPRPRETRDIAMRMQGWRDVVAPCQNCLSATATRIVGGGIALCMRCRDQRASRMEDMRRLDRASRSWHGTIDSSVGNVLEGYSIVTDVPSVDLGGFIERIMPEALVRTVLEGIDLLALWNHNSDVPIGRISANRLAVRIDSAGLQARIATPKSAAAQVEAVDVGIVKGQSFGFRAIDDEWLMDGHMPVRHVTDMRISEVSVVTFPAYPQTTITVAKDRGKDDRYYRMRMAR